MTFPHEAEINTEIATRYRTQLDAMTSLHDVVVRMLTSQSWSIGKPRGLNPAVVEAMVGLLSKATKSFRAIQLLCERGLYHDANALVRVLIETTTAILFILQKKSKERCLIYHAHSMSQDLKMLNEWSITSGLKRAAKAAMRNQYDAELAKLLKRLSPGTDVRRHWSGKANLQQALKALRGDVVYATAYRFTSSISHASDFAAHIEFDPASDEMIYQIEPHVKGFEAPSYAARQLLWSAANRINQRIGLGFDAALAPHRLTRADVELGQR